MTIRFYRDTLHKGVGFLTWAIVIKNPAELKDNVLISNKNTPLVLWVTKENVKLFLKMIKNKNVAILHLKSNNHSNSWFAGILLKYNPKIYKKINNVIRDKYNRPIWK
jgi:hemolysin-activating ACP:hemolysin acyltransferase